MRGKRSVWLFACDCGKTAEFVAVYVKEGKVKSCGCLNHNGRPRVNHGRCKRGRSDRTYTSWNSAKVRCENPNAPNYALYGGRGIGMCERWANDFREFLADMGERPEGTSLDRIDNEKGYEPSNCRWATITQQAANRRTTHVNEDGEAWVQQARRNGITACGFNERIKRGWSYERSSTEPMWNRGRRATSGASDSCRS